jgi:hypothetical protein
MSDPFLDSTRNLARWLQEAGKRRAAGAPAPQAAAPERGKPGFSFITDLKRTRWLPLAALAALAYLQYFYADAFLQINSLPLVLVFLF